MSHHECPVCGADDPTVSVTVNNSDSQYYDEDNPKGPSENDVTFDIEFPGGDDVSSVHVCEDCYNNSRHLTDEYVEEHLN